MKVEREKERENRFDGPSSFFSPLNSGPPEVARARPFRNEGPL